MHCDVKSPHECSRIERSNEFESIDLLPYLSSRRVLRFDKRGHIDEDEVHPFGDRRSKESARTGRKREKEEEREMIAIIREVSRSSCHSATRMHHRLCHLTRQIERDCGSTEFARDNSGSICEPIVLLLRIFYRIFKYFSYAFRGWHGP